MLVFSVRMACACYPRGAGRQLVGSGDAWVVDDGRAVTDVGDR